MDLVAVSPFNPDLSKHDVIIYDSTLRDGEQTPGVAFTREQKLAIARKLDEIKVPQIEAGFPAVSVSEMRTIKEITSLGLNAEILALTRVIRKDIDCTVESGADMALLFVGTSDIHLRYKLKKTREEIIDMAVDAIDYCKERGILASISAEDGTRTDLDFLLKFFKKAEEAGASRLGVTDTLGCATPEAVSYMVSRVVAETHTPVSVHMHNDFGFALANAIAGIKAGATAVTTTVNGIGERTGNVPLEQFAVSMKYLYKKDLGIDCTGLKSLSDMVSEYSKLEKAKNLPLVGEYCFSHESGIHVAAILNCPLTYESIMPELVGNHRQIIMGKHTGINYVKKRLEDLNAKASDEQAASILQKVKETGERKGRVSDNEFLEIVRQAVG